ncbi:MAG: phosphatase PAP2 family protein [Acidimicrobiales bacterium]
MSDIGILRLPKWVDKMDVTVDRAWENLRGRPGLDRVFYLASAAGDFSLIWHAFNVGRLLAKPEGRVRFVRLASALAVESLIVNQVIKRAFDRERPEQNVERPHHLRTPSTTSFPSGHASSAAMATSLIAQRSALGPAAGIVGAVVATSRLHVRIHHASDVVAGAAVGLALAAAWKRLWPLE